MTTTAQPESSPRQYKILGTRPMRHDAYDKVTGAAKFGADINMPGMLHGKVLRSPYSHARIRSIDTSKAEALPGVLAVATSADFPILKSRPLDYENFQGNPRLIGENCMALDKALYKGHAVAAVAATSPHIAELALDLIEVAKSLFWPYNNPTVLWTHPGNGLYYSTNYNARGPQGHALRFSLEDCFPKWGVPAPGDYILSPNLTTGFNWEQHI